MKPFWRNIKKHISIDGPSILTLMIIMVVTITITGFYAEREITIMDNENILKVSTKLKTVGDLLKDQKITLSEYDTIDHDYQTKIRNLPRAKIQISRAVPVVLKLDGTEQLLMTTKDTIEHVLENNNIALSDLDYIVNHSKEDKVSEGMEIEVVRVTEELEVKTVPVPFSSETRKNKSLSKSVVKIIQQGVKGERQLTYKTTFENGKEVKKEVVKDILTKAPVNKVTEIGTTGIKELSRGGYIRYKDVMQMQATAYTLSYSDTGKRPGDKDYGITASGRKAQRGVIAVDPRVIPLGTKLYVESIGNLPDYGYAVAGDTGGAIKGNIIDLFYDTQFEAVNWGRRNVRVYILND